MIQMVRVLEANLPDTGFLAEIPGHPGRFVRAEGLLELRTLLMAARVVGNDPGFVYEGQQEPSSEVSATAIFLKV